MPPRSQSSADKPEKTKSEVDAPPVVPQIKCSKCGSQNPASLKFCGNCGSKLGESFIKRFDALALLHFTGGFYLLLSVIMNPFAQSTMIFALYITSLIFGFYAGYAFYSGKISKYLKLISITSIAVGLIGTMLLYIVGLSLHGVIGPAFVIYVFNMLALWKAWREL